MASNAFVNDKIKSKKVMMFSKTTCPFCLKAKKVFNKLLSGGDLNSEDYEVVEIDKNPNCSQIQDHLGKITGARSVPRVFVNGNCIGGGDDVVDLDRKGKLVPMLKA